LHAVLSSHKTEHFNSQAHTIRDRLYKITLEHSDVAIMLYICFLQGLGSYLEGTECPEVSSGFPQSLYANPEIIPQPGQARIFINQFQLFVPNRLTIRCYSLDTDNKTQRQTTKRSYHMSWICHKSVRFTTSANSTIRIPNQQYYPHKGLQNRHGTVSFTIRTSKLWPSIGTFSFCNSICYSSIKRGTLPPHLKGKKTTNFWVLIINAMFATHHSKINSLVALILTAT
jgi:hypothetical protein